MDAKELFVSQFEDGASQLGAAFADFPADSWDAKSNPMAMSARETVVHLTEAYIACGKHLNGEKLQWGSYVAESDDPNRLLAVMIKERDIIKMAALAADPAEYKIVLAYASNHDYYHVGQMVTLRLHLDPTWNADSIYSSSRRVSVP